MAHRSFELAVIQQAALPDYSSLLGQSLFGPTTLNSPQMPLNMLADLSERALLGTKRSMVTEDFGLFQKHSPVSPMKRLRTKSPDFIPTKATKMSRTKQSLGDHPILLARLAKLGGSFPMPSSTRVQRSLSDQSANKARMSPVSRKRSVSISHQRGGFPLPKLSGSPKTTKQAMNLRSFEALWQGTSPELRKQVLSRKLAQM